MTAERPALLISACGNPVNRLAASAPSPALAVFEALGDHRAMQVEEHAVIATLLYGITDHADDMLEGGILDRARGRRPGGDRQHHLRPFPLGQVEIGAEP